MTDDTKTPPPHTHLRVSDEAVTAACRAHTPQFDRLDADIARYAKEQMRHALTAALKVMEISQ